MPLLPDSTVSADVIYSWIFIPGRLNTTSQHYRINLNAHWIISLYCEWFKKWMWILMMALSRKHLMVKRNLTQPSWPSLQLSNRWVNPLLHFLLVHSLHTLLLIKANALYKNYIFTNYPRSSSKYLFLHDFAEILEECVRYIYYADSTHYRMYVNDMYNLLTVNGECEFRC